MLRRLVAVVLVVGAVASCGRGDSGAEAEPKQRTEQVTVEVTAEIDGDLKGRFEKQRVDAMFVMLRSTDPKTAENDVFGIEPVAETPAGGPSFKAGFAIHPFRGDGTYTIEPGSPLDAVKEMEKAQKEGGGVRGKSSVRVEWSDTGKPEVDAVEFLRRDKPCKVKVESDGNEGRLQCPQISQEGSTKRFSLDLRWRVVGTVGAAP